MCDNGVHGNNSPKQKEQGKTKVCSKCGETKPVNEFHKLKHGKYGVRTACKVCSKAYSAKYYAENVEKERSRMAKWRSENAEKHLACVKKWQRANPDRKRAYNQRRRANKRNAPGDFTAAEWKAKLEYYGYRCRYCGIHKSETNEGWLEADHAIPLSRGGANFISNIVPACRSCNASKHAKTFTEYLDGQ